MRGRRAMTVLVAAAVALVAVAGGVAADRLRAPGPFAVRQIDPPYTFLKAPPPPAKPRPVVKPVQRSSAARSACPAAPEKVTDQVAVVGRAVPAQVKVYDRPDGRHLRTLTNPTGEGQPLYALVKEMRGFWLRVQLVARPNGSTGWVRMTDFSQYETPYRILVQRCAKRLVVYRSGREVWRRTVAVGKPRTPTPAGEFFVDFITPMRCCAYGPMMLSVAGFSNVLHQFGKGGTGQIAIHGTSADWSVGKAASNGCVRMHNADIVALAKLVPPGTPVTITD